MTNSLRCACYKCGKEVPTSVMEHFTAVDGRILCKECSVGIKPISSRLKKKLYEIENNGYTVNAYNWR